MSALAEDGGSYPFFTTLWRSKMNSIKDMVSGGKMVKLTRYQRGDVWYITDCGFEFPVPISDVGDAALLAEDKAMLLMRYIRKHMELIVTAKSNTNK